MRFSLYINGKKLLEISKVFDRNDTYVDVVSKRRVSLIYLNTFYM